MLEIQASDAPSRPGPGRFPRASQFDLDHDFGRWGRKAPRRTTIWTALISVMKSRDEKMSVPPDRVDGSEPGCDRERDALRPLRQREFKRLRTQASRRRRSSFRAWKKRTAAGLRAAVAWLVCRVRRFRFAGCLPWRRSDTVWQNKHQSGTGAGAQPSGSVLFCANNTIYLTS